MTTIKLSPDGFEKIEAKIQEIENLAGEGVFTAGNTTDKFHRIGAEAKNLRQIIREVFIAANEPEPGKPGAA